MPHAPKPFYRKARTAFYVQLGKQQIKLVAGPDDAATAKLAWAAFHQLMAGQPAAPARNSAKSAAGPSAVELFDRFLDWTGRHREPGTFGWYRDRIQGFVDSLPAGVAAADVRPFHVQQWVDGHAGWGDTTRRQAAVAVQRAYNWAYKLGHLADNPLRHVEKPKAKRREQAVTPASYADIVAHYKPGDPFRDLLAFCWETGCRPMEATRVEARHVDLAGLLVVFPPGEAKGKKKHRRILLTEAAAAVLRPLIDRHPAGPLFRNADGNPWHRYAINCRFVRLKEKLGEKFCLYSTRHGYCQKLLEAGNDHLTVAELMGHSTGQMVATVYSHMNRADDHLRKALNKGQ